MPREKECYRDNLEELNAKFKEQNAATLKKSLKAKFPKQNVLTLKDVCEYLDCDHRTAKASVPFKRVGAKYIVPITNFARWLS